MRTLAVAAFLLAALGTGLAAAQEEAPPEFAPPNLTPEGVRALAANCVPCHGPAGRPVAGSVIPALGGRPREALAAAMDAFKAGRRPATVMDQIAKGYSEAEIAALAAYFASVEP